MSDEEVDLVRAQIVKHIDEISETVILKYCALFFRDFSIRMMAGTVPEDLYPRKYAQTISIIAERLERMAEAAK